MMRTNTMIKSKFSPKDILNSADKFNELIDDYRHTTCLAYLCTYLNKNNVLCRKTSRENYPLCRKEIEDIFENSRFKMKKRATADFLNRMLKLNVMARLKPTPYSKEVFMVNPTYCNMAPAGKINDALFDIFSIEM